MTLSSPSTSRSSNRSAVRTFCAMFAAVSLGALVVTGCSNNPGDSTEDTTDSVVQDSQPAGTDTTDPKTTDASTTDSAAEAAAVTIDDVLGSAVEYVNQSWASLDPQKPVDPAGYCSNFASTLRDPQSQVAAPTSGKVPQPVLDAVKTWKEQTALLAATLDKCAASSDAAAFVSSKEYGAAVARFNACVENILKK